MPMSSPYQIVLSAREAAVLAARSRSVRGPYRDRLRAKIVLAAAAGQDNAAIARQLGVYTDTDLGPRPRVHGEGRPGPRPVRPNLGRSAARPERLRDLRR